MIDHVERDLGRGAVMIPVFEPVVLEVVRRHQLLQVASINQTVVNLLADDLVKFHSLFFVIKPSLRVILWK